MGSESRFERLVDEARQKELLEQQQQEAQCAMRAQQEIDIALAKEAKIARDLRHEGTPPSAVFTAEEAELCEEFLETMSRLQNTGAVDLCDEVEEKQRVQRKRWLLPSTYEVVRVMHQELITQGFPIGYSIEQTKAKNDGSIEKDIYLCIDGLLRQRIGGRITDLPLNSRSCVQQPKIGQVSWQAWGERQVYQSPVTSNRGNDGIGEWRTEWSYRPVFKSENLEDILASFVQQALVNREKGRR